MARVTYGPLITELAGSIGGITFQRNSSGSIARLKPNKPVNSSWLQQARQTVLSTVIALWPTLSFAQQTGWNNFAAAHDHADEYGNMKTISGFQWFVSCNLNLATASAAYIMAAPVWSILSIPDLLTWVVDNRIRFMFDAEEYVSPEGQLFLYSTGPIHTTVYGSKKNKLLLGQCDYTYEEELYIDTLFYATYNLTDAILAATNNASVVFAAKLIDNSTGLCSNTVFSTLFLREL
jgi:hypothetical protein